MKPRYPVYVISKGRWKTPMTARFLKRDGVDFRVVVEPQEAEEYGRAVGAERVLVLPFSNLGQGSIPARNWCWEHAREAGAERHWILDDNIGMIRRLYYGKRIPCDSGPAFASIEDFVERYENVAVGGMNYQMFGVPGIAPYHVNCHVYSALLIRNDLEFRWRGRLNEDTDLCLQALTSGWCTLLVNVFLIDKKTTMTMKGGNTEDLYQGDGRLEMSRSLQRAWPGIVDVKMRYGRHAHVIDWTRFADAPALRLRPGVDLDALEPNEYGLTLKAVSEVKSPALRRLLEQAREEAGIGADLPITTEEALQPPQPPPTSRPPWPGEDGFLEWVVEEHRAGRILTAGALQCYADHQAALAGPPAFVGAEPGT